MGNPGYIGIHISDGRWKNGRVRISGVFLCRLAVYRQHVLRPSDQGHPKRRALVSRTGLVRGCTPGSGRNWRQAIRCRGRRDPERRSELCRGAGLVLGSVSPLPSPPLAPPASAAFSRASARQSAGDPDRFRDEARSAPVSGRALGNLGDVHRAAAHEGVCPLPQRSRAGRAHREGSRAVEGAGRGKTRRRDDRGHSNGRSAHLRK